MKTRLGLCDSLISHFQLTWAIISSLLTIHLTASNSFVTRKDSCALDPSFADADEDKDLDAVQPPHKRRVMYYVRANDQPTTPHHYLILHRLREAVSQRSRRSFRGLLSMDILAAEPYSLNLWVSRYLLLRDCR